MQPSSGSSAGAPTRVRHEPVVVPTRQLAGESSLPSITVPCQECGAAVEVTEALRAQVEQRVMQRIGREQRAREDSLREAHAREIAAIREQTEAAARSRVEIELRDLRAATVEKNAALARSSETELELRSKLRALEEKQKTFDLEVARKVDEQTTVVRATLVEQLREEHRLQISQKDEQLASLGRTADELRRKIEQGSQQLQGEAAESELERVIGSACPLDQLTPIGQGVRGGDFKHVVRNAAGSEVGVILWDVKNTKNWSDGWIEKLRDDQQREKADIAVLVTAALPSGVKSFGLYKGVLVCVPSHASALCSILRTQLLQLHTMRLASEGRADKKELVYRYLASPEFHERVVSVLETYDAMRQDLTKEKAYMERQWAKREKQLDKGAAQGAGIIGDLQGIIGRGAPEFEVPTGDEAESRLLPPVETESESED
jgi:hypothetical protein